jgi:hypothetical protein
MAPASIPILKPVSAVSIFNSNSFAWKSKFSWQPCSFAKASIISNLAFTRLSKSSTRSRVYFRSQLSRHLGSEKSPAGISNGTASNWARYLSSSSRRARTRCFNSWAGIRNSFSAVSQRSYSSDHFFFSASVRCWTISRFEVFLP